MGQRNLVREIKEEGDLLFVTGEAFANDFALESASFFESEVLVVLSQTGLSLLVYHQYESDSHFFFNGFTRRERERERSKEK